MQALNTGHKKILSLRRPDIWTSVIHYIVPMCDGNPSKQYPLHFWFGRATLYLDHCVNWFNRQAANSIHPVVTDLPYGLLKYSAVEQAKPRAGEGGDWCVSPSFDGSKCSPLLRFTVLKPTDLDELQRLFQDWGRSLMRVLVPGTNVVQAGNLLLSCLVSGALAKSGLK